jgi:hypothetical protein
VKRRGGHVAAVDIENPEAPLAPPSIDIRTGRAAIRGTITPSSVVIAVSVLAILTSGVGWGLAAWFQSAPVSAQSAEPDEVVAVEILTAARRSQADTFATVEALSAALPSSAYLESLEIDAGNVKLAGRTRDATLLPRALEKHPDFSGVSYSGPTRESGDGWQDFEITLLRGAAREQQ